MFVQCPQCKSGNLIDDGELAAAAQLQIRCARCRAPFLVAAATGKAIRADDVLPAPEPKELKTSGARNRLPSGKHVSLVAMEGPMKGEIFRISKAQVSIGRKAADVVINDPEISSVHCALEVREEVADLTDVGSTNGTFIDGKQIQHHQLAHLSEFRIGGTTLMFVVTNPE